MNKDEESSLRALLPALNDQVYITPTELRVQHIREHDRGVMASVAKVASRMPDLTTLSLPSFEEGAFDDPIDIRAYSVLQGLFQALEPTGLTLPNEEIRTVFTAIANVLHSEYGVEAPLPNDTHVSPAKDGVLAILTGAYNRDVADFFFKSIDSFRSSQSFQQKQTPKERAEAYDGFMAQVRAEAENLAKNNKGVPLSENNPLITYQNMTEDEYSYESNFNILLEIIRSSPKLTSVKLPHCCLGKNRIKKLMEAVRDNPSIVELEMSNSHPPMDINEFMDIFKHGIGGTNAVGGHVPALKKLNLSSSFSVAFYADQLLKGFKRIFPNLEDVNLVGESVRFSQAGPNSEPLVYNIGDSGMQPMTGVNMNVVGDDRWESAEKQLEKWLFSGGSSNLHQTRISKLGINLPLPHGLNDGVFFGLLTKTLQEYKWLTSLDISDTYTHRYYHSPADKPAADSFANTLINYPRLSELNLSNSHIFLYPSSVDIILTGAKKHPKLARIDISKSYMVDCYAAEIAELIKTAPALEEIDISSCGISECGIDLIADAIAQRATTPALQPLSKVRMGTNGLLLYTSPLLNHVSEKAMESLRSAVRSNSRLEIDLDGIILHEKGDKLGSTVSGLSLRQDNCLDAPTGSKYQSAGDDGSQSTALNQQGENSPGTSPINATNSIVDVQRNVVDPPRRRDIKKTAIDRMAAAYRGNKLEGDVLGFDGVSFGQHRRDMSTFIFMKNVDDGQLAEIKSFMEMYQLNGNPIRYRDKTGTTVNVYVGYPEEAFKKALDSASPDIRNLLEAGTVYVGKKGNKFRLSSQDSTLIDTAEDFLRGFAKIDNHGYAIGIKRTDNHIDVSNPSKTLRSLLLQAHREQVQR